jgi:hypothetical protein
MGLSMGCFDRIIARKLNIESGAIHQQYAFMRLRLTMALILAAASTVWAADRGAPVAEPQVLLKMAQGLESCGIEGIVSKFSEDSFTYHLTRLEYIGYVDRDGQRFHLGQAFFIRSRASEEAWSPARGHTFFVMFDSKYNVISHVRGAEGTYYMQGTVLRELGEEERSIADFASTEPFVRYRGWMIGDNFLPYPFADKISEEAWNTGAFRGPRVGEGKEASLQEGAR